MIDKQVIHTKIDEILELNAKTRKKLIALKEAIKD